MQQQKMSTAPPSNYVVLLSQFKTGLLYISFYFLKTLQVWTYEKIFDL